MTEVETPLDVTSILQSGPQYKSIVVDKDDIKYDLGYLSAYDYHPIDNQELKRTTTNTSDSTDTNSNEPNYLLELTRDNAQLLFSKIFQLPSKVVTDGVLAELPKPATLLPRAKPLPQAREPTKWEKFAKIKGIQKKSRKPQLVWDDDHQEYRRRYGYKRANNPEDQWIIPAKDNGNNKEGEAGTDPWTKMKQEKQVKLDKQKEKEQKNKSVAKLEKARSQASKGAKLKDDISRTFALVSRSTASLGRFDRRLPGETEAPKVKGTRKVAGVGAAVGDGKAEKTSNLVLLDKMLAKEDRLNKDKAASQFNKQEAQTKQKRNREQLLNEKTKRAKK